jgi:hypothetical protein
MTTARPSVYSQSGPKPEKGKSVKPFNRQDTPPRSGPELPVVRLKASGSTMVVILSASLWGIWTHWNGSKTEPCYREKKQCPACKKGLPKRWKGYLHCWDYAKKREIFLELTPTSADQLLSQCGKDVPLRGNRMNVNRGAGDKARLRLTVLTAVPPAELPAGRDPEVTLQKLWGLDDTLAFEQQPTILPNSEAI